MGNLPVRRPAEVRQPVPTGWIYIVQWENDPHSVKIGFSTDLPSRMASFLTACRHGLLILKVFRGPQEEEQRLHERFDGCRGDGEWFDFTPGLQRFMRQEMPCHTKEARTLFGGKMSARVKWQPLTGTKRELLEVAQKACRVPKFVNNARDYVLWTIEDIDGQGFFCTSNGIIHHPSNQGLYEVKTIYNSLASVVADGLATKNSAKCYRLTDEGMAMLLKAEEDYEDQLPPRKSAASTRLGRGML
jgi:hypothetical protein